MMSQRNEGGSNLSDLLARPENAPGHIQRAIHELLYGDPDLTARQLTERLEEFKQTCSSVLEAYLQAERLYSRRIEDAANEQERLRRALVEVQAERTAATQRLQAHEHAMRRARTLIGAGHHEEAKQVLGQADETVLRLVPRG